MDAGLRDIDVSRVAAAAESAASAVVAGGRLFVTGSADFVSEARVRGGGMMMVEELTGGSQACRANDVVLVGWTLEVETARQSADVEALLYSLSSTAACTIGIGPVAAVDTLPRGCAAGIHAFYHLPSRAPGLDGVADILAGGHPYALHSLQSIALLWVLTAELAAALTRRGEMAVFYQSVLVEGGRERNGEHEAASVARFNAKANSGPARLEASHTVPPQPAGKLGGRYVAELRARLAQMADRDAGPVAKAAALCADARSRGNTVHAYLIGHFPVHQSGRPGDPKVLAVLNDGRHGELPSEEVRTLQSLFDKQDAVQLIRDSHSASTGVARKSSARRRFLPRGILSKAAGML